jgi:hypothetical protein
MVSAGSISAPTTAESCRATRYRRPQDPFERTPSIQGETLNNLGGGYMNDSYAREFWRFVLVQKTVADLAKTAITIHRYKTRLPSTWTRERSKLMS